MDRLDSCTSSKTQFVFVPHARGRAAAVKLLALAIALVATALSFHPSLWRVLHEIAGPTHSSEQQFFDWFAVGSTPRSFDMLSNEQTRTERS